MPRERLSLPCPRIQIVMEAFLAKPRPTCQSKTLKPRIESCDVRPDLGMKSSQGQSFRKSSVLGLLFVNDHPRRKAAHFDLRAHFLEARSESFNLFLLARYRGFLFLVLPVLFQKFI